MRQGEKQRNLAGMGWLGKYKKMYNLEEVDFEKQAKHPGRDTYQGTGINIVLDFSSNREWNILSRGQG